MDDRKLDEHVECLINGYIRDITKQADEDYITSRLCYKNGLIPNFLWSAQQSIEKYLKAIALFQRIDVRNEGHDLYKLFLKINQSFPLESIQIYFPKKVENITFTEELFEDFLKRITKLGMNRYVTRSWYVTGDELIKLDATVYTIRRYCHPIGAVLGQSGRPFSKEIKKQIDEGRYDPIDGFLGEELRKNSHYSDLLSEGNFYFPKPMKITEDSFWIRTHNHTLDIRQYDAENGPLENKKIYVKLAEFIINHLYFEKNIKHEIQRNIDKFRKMITSQ